MKELDIKRLHVHKTRIHPNNKQASFFEHCCSVHRTAYNWGLRWWMIEYECKKEYLLGGSPSAFKADKVFNAVKSDKFPWMYEGGKLIAPNCVGQKAIVGSLKLAFSNFFGRLGKGETGKDSGYPNFKRRPSDSFELTNAFVKSCHVHGNRLRLPKGQGWVRMAKAPKRDGKLECTTISRAAGKWYVSLRYTTEHDIRYQQSPDKMVGVDVGIAKYAVLSDGKVFETVSAYDRLKKKKARAQRKLSRMQGPDKRTKQKPSNAWIRQKEKVAKIDREMLGIRENNAHHVSKAIAQGYGAIFMEDLKIKNMTKSAKGDAENPGKNVKQKSGLNRSMLDKGFHGLKTKIDYKAKRHGSELHLVNPAYTSQDCAACGHRSKENRKTQAEFKCVECGYTENADLNAARNILLKGMELLSAQDTKSRAGQGSETLVEAPRKSSSKQQSVKPVASSSLSHRSGIC